MNLEHNSIDYSKVLSTDYYLIKNKSLIFKIWILIKFTVRLGIKVYEVFEDKKDTRWLFFKSSYRKDANIFFDRIQSCCDQNPTFIDIRQLKTKVNFNWVPVLFSQGRVFYILKKKYSFIDSLFLYVRFTEHYNTVRSSMNDARFENVVVFGDMRPMDNLIVQHFKSMGSTTITLQHALFIDYIKYDNVSVTNIQSIVSDHFLAWGEETKELVKQYHPDVEVHICGKPLEVITISPNRETADSEFFTVIFDQNLHEKYNQKLLDIADHITNKTGLKYCIRFHPTSLKKNYIINHENVVEDLDLYQSTFVIGHTTTFIFELMIQGVSVYKLDTIVPMNKMDDKFKFKSYEELMNRIRMDIDFKEEAKYYIKYTGEESLNKYKQFFSKL
jgi:hypothetical protein